MNVGDERVDVSFVLYQSRAAINAQGDFILTSNRNLYLGNTRSGEVNLVYEAPRFSEFQEVAINDSGQYVATTFETVVAGSAVLPPTVLLEEALGTFGIYDVWDSFNSVDVNTGESRLVLDDQGRFVAVASSGVYTGQVGESASAVYEERYAGFRHVRLTPAGYIVLSDNDAFVGTF